MNHQIVVESDSKNALSWVTNKQGCAWRLSFMFNKLKNIIKCKRGSTIVRKIVIQNTHYHAFHVPVRSTYQNPNLDLMCILVQARYVRWFEHVVA